MLKPWEVVAELESDNSRLFKEGVVEREAVAGNAEFFRGCRAAFDAMITFGVRQVPEAVKDGAGLKPDAFWKVAQQLAERELTGDAARNAIVLMLHYAIAVRMRKVIALLRKLLYVLWTICANFACAALYCLLVCKVCVKQLHVSSRYFLYINVLVLCGCCNLRNVYNACKSARACA